MKTPLRIGIIGDFDRAKHSHWATEAALFHAAAKLQVHVEPTWVPTCDLERPDGVLSLESFDGLWASPGSPYRSLSGMLAGIEFARVRDVPFLGTCGGFQYTLIEFTRNVLGIADANSAENAPLGRHIVITPIACAVPGVPSGCPRLNGTSTMRVVPGTQIERACGGGNLRGEYFCSFEVNKDYIREWEAAGLRVAAVGGDGEMRALELPGKRHFVAMLFQPQLSSSFERPHPIIVGYLGACITSC
jgi:CTP synthase (UTP-ammonia lyase)